jgi:phage terminase large subunit-like protein
VKHTWHIPGYDPDATAAPGDWYDAKAGERVIGFFRDCLTHVKGEWSGQSFTLPAWQADIIRCLFGWKREDGTRRYRTAFIYVPRKNGKSTLVAGIAVYALFCDNEPGAECYCAAAEREQAFVLFSMAADMVQNEEHLAKRSTLYVASKTIKLRNCSSFLRAISADAHTKHGYSPQLAIVDELHVQPNRALVDVLKTGMGARRQPLMIYLTTADFVRPSICNETLDYARGVRDGTTEDRSFLPVIYEATREDDPYDEAVWAKANPGFPVSPKREFLIEEFTRARSIPSFLNTAKRLYLNIQTDAETTWLDMDAWGECGGFPTEEDLKGVECLGAIDLAQKQDIAAFALYWPSLNACRWWYWCPEDIARLRIEYQPWVEGGWLMTTPGNRIDYTAIRETVVRLTGEYRVRDIAFDPWDAFQLASELQEDHGLAMYEFRQGFQSMSAPAKELERLVATRQFRHGDNPVSAWMASHVAIKEDPAGNIKPVKPTQASVRKIDGIVASVMAIGRSMATDETPTPGIVVL